MAKKTFFNEQLLQSNVKSDIVVKFFDAWSKIMALRKPRIAYIDLFCGPGIYKNGALSTPIKIIQKILENNNLTQKVVTVFNDIDKNNIDELKKNIDNIEDVDKLNHKSQFHNEEVDDKIANFFNETNMIPSLAFIDPFGYKGLTRSLIKGVSKNWGCDVIFFFNYNRINPGIRNDKIKNYINAIFGENRADKLRELVFKQTTQRREYLVMKNLEDSMNELGANYMLTFKFLNGNKISHFLVYLCKEYRGFQIMKEIMANAGNKTSEDVPLFEFQFTVTGQMPLFGEDIPHEKTIKNLEEVLLEQFKGQSISTKSLIENHSPSSFYVPPNYKTALVNLEEKGLISCTPPAEKRQIRKGKRTCGDNVKLQF